MLILFILRILNVIVLTYSGGCLLEVNYSLKSYCKHWIYGYNTGFIIVDFRQNL